MLQLRLRLVGYVFTANTSDPEYVNDNITSFTGASANLNITGLPFSSEPGEYTFLFPFGIQPGVGPDENGFFTLCSPSNFLLTYSNENYLTGTCSGGREGYQFNINQSQLLTMKVEDSSVENTYPTAQTRGLFFVALGFTTLITSLTFADSPIEKETKALLGKVQEQDIRLEV